MDEEGILNLLAQDPGNSVFAEYAEQLREKDRQQEAIIICLKGLSRNPTCHRGRLIFARCLFQMGCLSFAIEQVRVLSEFLPENAAIKKLHAKLSHGQSVVQDNEHTVMGIGTDDTLAEADFDFGEIDSLDEEEKK